MQQVEEGYDYKLNNYVIKDGNIYYNTLTDEGVFVEDFEADKLALIKRWFLVPDVVDIKTIAHAIRQKRLYSKLGPGSQLKQNFVIFTTTACNASCEYCFEKTYDTITMSEETAKDVADYIIKMSSVKKPKLRWFGGEPLVNKKAMNIINERLLANGMDYWSEISTNGDLFPKCSDEEIISWKPRIIQFTVDAVGEEYDKIKGLPAEAYERLKETIVRLGKILPNCRVNIRVHLNPVKGPDVCYKIIDDFVRFKNVKIYARILYHSAKLKDYKDLLKIEDYILLRGGHESFRQPFGYVTHCMADNSRIACINPNGELSPCEHYAFGEYMYGSIYKKDKDQNILRKWSIREKYTNPSCNECVLYPLCRKIVMCPAEGKCSDGYQYYQIETIKRALRKKVEEIGGN